MTNLAQWLEQRVQRWAFKDEFMPSPAGSVYVALHSGDPTDSADENEVTAADYDRIEVPSADWEVDTGANSRATNLEPIVWPEAATDWGTITHVSLWTGASASANPLYWGEFTTTEPVNEGEQFEIRDGDLQVDLI